MNLKIQRKLNLTSFEKGIYMDNAKNRKLNRVGQHYGKEGEDEKKGVDIKEELSPEEQIKKHKEKQWTLLQKVQKMHDDVHAGIRSEKEIHTFEEFAIDNADDNLDIYPDFTQKDVDKALKEGKITIYSSYPIKEGTFCSPSAMCAKDYSSDGKIYSKVVGLNDVAWLSDMCQGEYAPVEDTKKTEKKKVTEDEFKKDYKTQFKIDDNTVEMKLQNEVYKTIGKILCYKDPESKTISLESLHIDEDQRGKGLSHHFLKNFLDELKLNIYNKQFNKLTLHVDSALNHKGTISNAQKKKNNERLVKLYKKYGFKVSDQYDDGECQMTLKL